MRLFQIIASIAIISIFSACQKDDVAETTASIQNVDQRLLPYFEEFERQASLRGIDADLSTARIIGKIEEIGEQHVAGQCTYGAAIDNEITIDQGFWDDFTQPFIREMVIFHELGHCFLERGHREGSHANGTCLSIMRSGLEDCRDNYNQQTKEEYLDELFFNQ